MKNSQSFYNKQIVIIRKTNDFRCLLYLINVPEKINLNILSKENICVCEYNQSINLIKNKLI